jgi:Na+-driven multidrug efflux pump
VVLGFGVIGIWLGMCLDWIIRGSFFYWRLASGKWLWKYR